MEVQDNLLCAKISQAAQANKSRRLTFPFQVSGHVCLSTLHQQHEYKRAGEQHVAKFMPQYNGPYTITNMDKAHSNVTLDLLNSPNIFLSFHTAHVVPYVKNDAILFSGCEFSELVPIITEEESEEFYIHDVITE